MEQWHASFSRRWGCEWVHPFTNWVSCLGTSMVTKAMTTCKTKTLTISQSTFNYGQGIQHREASDGWSYLSPKPQSYWHSLHCWNFQHTWPLHDTQHWTTHCWTVQLMHFLILYGSVERTHGCVQNIGWLWMWHRCAVMWGRCHMFHQGRGKFRFVEESLISLSFANNTTLWYQYVESICQQQTSPSAALKWNISMCTQVLRSFL